MSERTSMFEWVGMHRAPASRTHWIVRQNWRQRTVFYPILALIFGVHLHDIQAPGWAWALLVAHFFVYPHIVFWWAWRQTDAKLQRAAELRSMVLDTFLYTLWAAGLGFPLWPCFNLLVATMMSMVAYHGVPGLRRVSVGVLSGLAVGFWLFGPFTVHLQTGTAVTVLCILSLIGFLMMYAQDAYVRSLRLYQNHKHMRERLEEIGMLQDQLREAALRDPLTGLYNRRHLSEILPGILARCGRMKTAVTLVMMDIDHFKRVNDTYGHPAGDAMLVALAQLLQHSVREGDTVCRMGGEEFLLVMENAPLLAASNRIGAFCTAFAGLDVVHDGAVLRATMSCGLATFPEHGGDAPSLLWAADRALYAAKAGGRNRLEAASARI